MSLIELSYPRVDLVHGLEVYVPHDSRPSNWTKFHGSGKIRMCGSIGLDGECTCLWIVVRDKYGMIFLENSCKRAHPMSVVHIVGDFS